MGDLEGRLGRAKGGSLETMCSELVTLGITEAGEESTEVHYKVVSLIERELILQVLSSCQGIQTKAAIRLGINRNTLRRKFQDNDLL